MFSTATQRTHLYKKTNSVWIETIIKQILKLLWYIICFNIFRSYDAWRVFWSLWWKSTKSKIDENNYFRRKFVWNTSSRVDFHHKIKIFVDFNYLRRTCLTQCSGACAAELKSPRRRTSTHWILKHDRLWRSQTNFRPIYYVKSFWKTKFSKFS